MAVRRLIDRFCQGTLIRWCAVTFRWRFRASSLGRKSRGWRVGAPDLHRVPCALMPRTLLRNMNSIAQFPTSDQNRSILGGRLGPMARFMRLVNRFFPYRGASPQRSGWRFPAPGMRLAWLGPLVAVALALAGCDNDVRYVSPPPPPPVPPPPPPEYGLIFEDTFDGEALDGDKWTVASGNGCPEVCFGGDEDASQYSEGSVSVRDGSLFIEGGRNAGRRVFVGRCSHPGQIRLSVWPGGGGGAPAGGCRSIAIHPVAARRPVPVRPLAGIGRDWHSRGT